MMVNMDRPPVVMLGSKDNKSPGLGARIRSHFYENRGAYIGALGTVASAVAGAYGLHRGLERGNHMVAAANARHAVAVDSARRQAYGQGLGDGMAEYMTRRWGPPSVSGGLRAALARSGQR